MLAAAHQTIPAQKEHVGGQTAHARRRGTSRSTKIKHAIVDVAAAAPTVATVVVTGPVTKVVTFEPVIVEGKSNLVAVCILL